MNRPPLRDITNRCDCIRRERPVHRARPPAPIQNEYDENGYLAALNIVIAPIPDVELEIDGNPLFRLRYNDNRRV